MLGGLVLGRRLMPMLWIRIVWLFKRLIASIGRLPTIIIVALIICHLLSLICGDRFYKLY